MMTSSSTSNKIANLSFVCVLLVVLGHVKWQAVGDSWTVFGCVAHSVSRAVLPFFFAVSGYFLARHVDECGWWMKAISRRICSLLIPFAAWTILYMFEMFVVDVLLNIHMGRGFFTNLRGVWGDVRIFFGMSPFFYPALAPLWYLRNLFLLVVVSPVLVGFVNRFRGNWLLFLIVLHIIVLCTYCLGGLSFTCGIGAVLACCFSMEGLLYFSVGIWLARPGAAAPRTSLAWKRFGIAAGTGAIILLLITNISPSMIQWAYLMEGLSMPVLAFVAWMTISAQKWPGWIVSAAFPMYLMHPLFFDLGYGAADAIGASSGSSVWCWALYFVAVIGSLAVTFVVHRTSRPLSVILFGGR